jgi:hypothetical protein
MAWGSRRTHRLSLDPVLLAVYKREHLFFYPENEALDFSEILIATHRNAQCPYF